MCVTFRCCFCKAEFSSSACSCSKVSLLLEEGYCKNCTSQQVSTSRTTPQKTFQAKRARLNPSPGTEQHV
ncbi:hypothetical protein ARMGADRAFT_1017746 [Armillaria gallica]|uniref:Uncharacterized protein n=1 Tax=Armillaria gallica TaxID=47427 RepID=A0A2H3CRL3_ARMGA|nr:hypothetical protein ARMGADRAFT_1017746 [Armillaria gallica]